MADSATATSSVSGVISGLKTSDILDQLRKVESAPVTRLQTQQTNLNTTLSTWQSFNTQLLTFKTALDTLSSVTTFNAHSVSASSEAVIATNTGYSTIGDTSFSVLALAQANQLCTQGYADCETTLVGTGSLTLNGRIVTTDGLTLNGLRDAINSAGAGVAATVVDTGVAGTPYRLLLTSKTTGAAGAIALTPNVTGTDAPTFATVQEAQDAHLQFGSGATALDIYRPSNHVTDVIGGVALDLAQVTTSPVTVSVKADLGSVKDDVKAMLTACNEVMGFINEQSQYDPNQDTPPLFGDLRLMNVADQINRAITNAAAGADPSLCLLSQAGIIRAADGTLTLDETALDKALNENPTGVLKLFASYATGPEGVTYVSSKDVTKPSGEDGYSLEITQAATQSRVTAGVAGAAALGADETLTLNGVSVALTAGMTQAQVAEAINAVSARSGLHATFTGSDGIGAGSYLTLTRIAYGSSRPISAVSSLSNGGPDTSGLGQLLVTDQDSAGESGAGTGAVGLEVAGLIDGIAATGSGQMLTATTGDAEGLKLLVRTGVGVQSPVFFSTGIASVLDSALSFITEDAAGAYHSAVDGIQSQLEEVAKDITTAQSRVDERMARYTAQFNAMEAALAKLQSQSAYMTSQLAQWNKQSS